MNAEQKEFFEKGKKAQLEGVTNNPYSENSRAGEAWSMGWYEALEAQLDDKSVSIHDLKHDYADEILVEE
jgi:hypothetical protein